MVQMDGILTPGQYRRNADDVDDDPVDDSREGRFIDDWVLVIAATNRPWAVDPAILRRLPKQIKVRHPAAGANGACGVSQTVW